MESILLFISDFFYTQLFASYGSSQTLNSEIIRSPIQKYCLRKTVYDFTEITFVMGAEVTTIKYSCKRKLSEGAQKGES
jgi:hypothetical protein